MLSGRYDAVLFDNDGVLVDSEPLFLQATRELLATVGVELDDATYHEISLRRGGTLFDLASERGITAAEVERLRASRNRRYAELIEQGVAVLDGVHEALTRLRGRHRAAVVTSSDRDHFDAIHRRSGLLEHFEFVLAGGDYSHYKPHPAPYLTAAARMGVEPARCLVIEDTERGLRSATAAGMACVVIPHALSRAGDFSRAAARLESMRGLPALLGLGASSTR